MSYSPTRGDLFIFNGPWYSAEDLLDFVIKIRRIDNSVRATRLQHLEQLNSLALPSFRYSLPTDNTIYYLPEFEGDWLQKFTDLRSYFTVRGTNKGNTSIKGTTAQSDDVDLASDEILKFWRTTEKIVSELKSLDYCYSLAEVQTKFNYAAPPPPKPKGQ
jgi:hypothetical protein